MRKRVVITGMGVVSPVGSGLESFWAAVRDGVCGIRPISRFDASGYAYAKAGEVTSWPLPTRLAGAEALDRGTQFMLTAAEEAMTGAAWEPSAAARIPFGVVLSTNFGGIASGEALLASLHEGKAPEPRSFAGYGFQACADRVAAAWRLRGPRTVLSLSCASGAAALACGAEWIALGRATAVLTGGYDEISPFVWSGLSALRTMSRDAVRPFDKKRDGTIFSEGAGAILIEDLEGALRRGAPILAEIAGAGLNNNAFHMTAPAKAGRGSAEVMQAALVDARLAPAGIDHINAHGTGTVQNDTTETQAIKTVFGDAASRIPITSIKSTTGHMMGAAGTVEVIASVQTIRTGIIPPTMNFTTPDPDCDLDYVTNAPRERRVARVLSNSAGIGGCNAAVVLCEYPARAGGAS